MFLSSQHRKPEELKSVVGDVLRSCVNRECSYNGCDSLCDLMLRDHGEYQDLDGDWPIFPKGYSQVLLSTHQDDMGVREVKQLKKKFSEILP